MLCSNGLAALRVHISSGYVFALPAVGEVWISCVGADLLHSKHMQTMKMWLSVLRFFLSPVQVSSGPSRTCS